MHTACATQGSIMSCTVHSTSAMSATAANFDSKQINAYCSSTMAAGGCGRDAARWHCHWMSWQICLLAFSAVCMYCSIDVPHVPQCWLHKVIVYFDNTIGKYYLTYSTS